MNRKILALMVVLTMVIGSFSLAYGAAPIDVIGTPVEQAVTRLVDLGVISGYPDGTFKPNDFITRAEYSVVVTKMKQLAEVPGATIFGDVPLASYAWAAKYINPATQAGIIYGKGMINGINSFGPALNITYEEAVAFMTRALGYETEAQANGGFPLGNLIVAQQKGLLAGVSGVVGMKATRGLVAQLSFNALEVPLAGTSGANAVYLFNDLHMINAAAASGNWGTINEATFAAAGITGVTASNIANLIATLQGAASGTNQNWSPTAIQGVLGGLGVNEVISANALNATELQIKFNVKLDAADATTKTPYKVSLSGVTFTGTPELSADGKTLVLTASAAMNLNNATLVVDQIKTAQNSTVKTDMYTKSFSFGDVDKPEIMEIESKTGTTIASTLKVKFNEPIKAIGSVKIDNILRTPTGFVAGDSEANFTGLALSTSTLHSIEIIGLKDQANNTAGILTEMFAVEVDESLLTDLQRATAAVTKFQLSQYQVDKDAAQLLVNLLPAGPDRVALQLLINAVVVIPQPVVTGVQAAPVVETTTGANAAVAVAAQVGVKGQLTLVGGDITITAKNTITDGSDIKIALIHQLGNNLPLQVALSGKEIQVGLATNGLGFDSSLTAEVVSAINASAGASALVTATGGSSSVATTMISTPLAGGLATIVASPAMPAVKAVYTLEITQAPNANGNAEVVGIGANVQVPVINGMNKDMVAATMAADGGLIGNATAAGYVMTAVGNKVIFTAIPAGAIGGPGPLLGLLNVTVQ